MCVFYFSSLFFFLNPFLSILLNIYTYHPYSPSLTRTLRILVLTSVFSLPKNRKGNNNHHTPPLHHITNSNSAPEPPSLGSNENSHLLSVFLIHKNSLSTLLTCLSCSLHVIASHTGSLLIIFILSFLYRQRPFIKMDSSPFATKKNVDLE